MLLKRPGGDLRLSAVLGHIMLLAKSSLYSRLNYCNSRLSLDQQQRATDARQNFIRCSDNRLMTHA